MHLINVFEMAADVSALNAQVFGELTRGFETLDEFEKQPTKTEGIFVMPKVQNTLNIPASPAITSGTGWSVTLMTLLRRLCRSRL